MIISNCVIVQIVHYVDLWMMQRHRSSVLYFLQIIFFSVELCCVHIVCTYVYVCHFSLASLSTFLIRFSVPHNIVLFHLKLRSLTSASLTGSNTENTILSDEIARGIRTETSVAFFFCPVLPKVYTVIFTLMT